MMGVIKRNICLNVVLCLQLKVSKQEFHFLFLLNHLLQIVVLLFFLYKRCSLFREVTYIYIYVCVYISKKLNKEHEMNFFLEINNKPMAIINRNCFEWIKSSKCVFSRPDMLVFFIQIFS
jgi:hypothetical protein